VNTTNTPVGSPASDDCNTPNASAVAACTDSTAPTDPAPNSHTTRPSSAGIPWPSTETGDQGTSNSPPQTGRAAANSCSADAGRTTNSPTDSTGSPAASAISSDIAPTHAGATRPRRRVPPAACNVTPCQEKGRTV